MPLQNWSGGFLQRIWAMMLSTVIEELPEKGMKQAECEILLCFWMHQQCEWLISLVCNENKIKSESFVWMHCKTVIIDDPQL